MGAGRRRAGIAAVALVAVAAFGWFVFPTRYDATPAPWSNPRVSRDGRSVRVSYLGGSCDQPGRVDVDEGDGTVRISAYSVVVRLTGCDDVAVGRSVLARLDSPLGDRRLVDGNAGYRP